MAEPNFVDIQVDEARQIAALQARLNRKFYGKPKDISVWSQLRKELVDGMAEIGFKVDVYPDPNRTDIWLPICDVVGRTDKRLEQYIAEQGGDTEKKTWYAQRVSADQLEKEGVDTGLLM